MKPPTSRFGCFNEDCEACHGDKEWRNRMTTLWVAGHNLSGYMPMSGPYLTTSWEAAKDSLLHDIDRHMESMWDALSMSSDQIYPIEEGEQWGATEIIDWWMGGNDRWISWTDLHWSNGTTRTYKGDKYQLCEYDYRVLKEISDGEEALKVLDTCEADASFGYHVGNEYYWIEESDRSANEIPEDLEGDELEEFIDRLNEMSY